MFDHYIWSHDTVSGFLQPIYLNSIIAYLRRVRGGKIRKRTRTRGWFYAAARVLRAKRTLAAAYRSRSKALRHCSSACTVCNELQLALARLSIS